MPAPVRPRRASSRSDSSARQVGSQTVSLTDGRRRRRDWAASGSSRQLGSAGLGRAGSHVRDVDRDAGGAQEGESTGFVPDARPTRAASRSGCASRSRARGRPGDAALEAGRLQRHHGREGLARLRVPLSGAAGAQPLNGPEQVYHVHLAAPAPTWASPCSAATSRRGSSPGGREPLTGYSAPARPQPVSLDLRQRDGGRRAVLLAAGDYESLRDAAGKTPGRFTFRFGRATRPRFISVPRRTAGAALRYGDRLGLGRRPASLKLFVDGSRARPRAPRVGVKVPLTRGRHVVRVIVSDSRSRRTWKTSGRSAETRA